MPATIMTRLLRKFTASAPAARRDHRHRSDRTLRAGPFERGKAHILSYYVVSAAILPFHLGLLNVVVGYSQDCAYEEPTDALRIGCGNSCSCPLFAGNRSNLEQAVRRHAAAQSDLVIVSRL